MNQSKLKLLDADYFNKVVPPSTRESIVASYRSVLADTKDINNSFFDAPERYDPYLIFCGPIPTGIPMGPDLSRVNICSLDFLSSLEGDHRILDYACGMGSFVHHANSFFPSFGFDRWIQLPRQAAVKHLHELGRGESVLVDLASALQLEPTIINVSGYWIEDFDLYKLDSVKYVLSDPLYNSGRVRGEGVFRYNGEAWSNTPEQFGYRRTLSYPVLDVYEKV